MKPPKINFLNPGAEAPRRRRFSFWKGALIALAALVVIAPVLFSIGSLRLIQAASMLNPKSGSRGKISLFEQVSRLVSNSERKLQGEDRDRVNILVLGEGGEGHDGPNLTDTMLLASLQPSTGRVALVSIPRDLWITMPDGITAKINAANAFAEARNPGSGGEATVKVVSDLLDQPVDYYVRIDFSAFKTLIDDVGGVTVNVDRPFTDYAYPTDGNLYQTIHFDKGWQTMDGDTALKFARSRHSGSPGEGSDFARSARQQKILAALKEKIVSFDTLLNPSKVASILETLQTHVITNMELWEIVKIAKFARRVKTNEIINHVLDDNPEGPLYSMMMPVSDGVAYVLLPRRGDWSEIQQMARNIFERDRYAEQKPAAPAQPLRLEIRNGTIRSGLAQKTRDLLSKVGYDVVRIGNNNDQNVRNTVVYDLTSGAHPEALSTLKGLLNADVSLSASGSLSLARASSDVDFLVVIGQNTNLN